ncbi:MAG: PTS sugar transporter subunit IIA [Spirochaetaceae bacterium]|jgi:PTS system nitrogen regulatory IIA component|nr:PTS sugar transporter subunit IIA [Spirochaetaceae bacterium]
MSHKFAGLIQRGGVFYHIRGNTPEEALKTLIFAIPILPSGIDREQLLTAVLEREALMSTAIGRGIALPHPRTPLITDPQEQQVIIAFLDREVDWKALDGEAVHTVMLIISASTKFHLHTLSEINFLCRQEKFYAILKDRRAGEEIVKAVKEAEQTWQ